MGGKSAMKLGNLACGAVRPQAPEWWNVDSLRSSLHPGTPERIQLDSEGQYIDQDLEKYGLPFDDNSFDGLLLSHALEHFDCHTAARIMADCLRALKPGGVLLVSVPDASYFRKVHAEDTVENAERLFGEPIFLGDGESTFTGYALWCPGRHRAIISEDVLWHYFVRAGFRKCERMEVASKRIFDPAWFSPEGKDVSFRIPFEIADEWSIGTLGAVMKMVALLNRLPFSLVMCAAKE